MTKLSLSQELALHQEALNGARVLKVKTELTMRAYKKMIRETKEGKTPLSAEALAGIEALLVEVEEIYENVLYQIEKNENILKHNTFAN